MATSTKRQKIENIEPKATGLWVDHELLRKHLGSNPKFLVDRSANNGEENGVKHHYLELADLALKRAQPNRRPRS